MARFAALILFWVLLGLWSCGENLQTIYVHPSGTPDAPGTVDAPLASLPMAIEKVLQLRKTYNGLLAIHLAGGTYRLEEPIKITPELGRLVLQGAGAAQVQVKGSQLLECTWQRYQDKIWMTKLNHAPAYFDQLYVNGLSQTMARYPNYDPAGGDWQGHAADAVALSRTQRWKNPVGGFVHTMHAGRWGDFHYLITGRDAQGELILQGGHQNNRPAPWHAESRMVENIFEELDTMGEWYYDDNDKTLYYWPPDTLDLSHATIEVSHLKHLIEMQGSVQQPVHGVTIEGIHFQHTQRTFMEPYHRLLRSDWGIYRGGALRLEGTSGCTIRECMFSDLGGNAIFINGHNRQVKVIGNHLYECGSSGICVVGDSTAVRSPSFRYEEFVDAQQLDSTPGPANELYPADCRLENNLIHRIGRIEKQVAGVQLSMAMNIQVIHNSIYDVPRAGINISEGTWGGHYIVYNDVFNTVLETGDHGAFNSWGRDRFWHPRWETIDSLVQAKPQMPYWDAGKTTIIYNNRFRCDHGWDIDLDDGSSNYLITQNLCLNGGIKLREGFYRRVENNIMINNGFHPHVWFANSGDVFTRNIMMTKHFPILLSGWGKEVNYNLFPDSVALAMAQAQGTDQYSSWGNPGFIDPEQGNYQVKAGSPALELGFKNFTLDSFGVQIPRLKKLAQQPPLPQLMYPSFYAQAKKTLSWLDATIKDIESVQEQSALGLHSSYGVILKAIPNGSPLLRQGFQANDVIINLEGQPVRSMSDLLTLYQEHLWRGHLKLTIVRGQKNLDLHLKT